MAFRSWVRLLGTTLGVGALAGACQLGLAYGLGIVRLTRVVDVTTRDQWTAQLAWVAWFAMVAAVVGALVGSWLLPAWGPVGAATAPSTTGAEDGDGAARPPALGAGTIIALGVAAGIGAAVVVPLTMQPARTAQIAGVNPVVVIAICATLGAVVGIFAACAAVAQPVSRWSLVAVSVAVWVIGIISVAPSLAPSDPLPAVRLGVFDAGFLSASITQRTALFTMPALALLAGGALGWRARRQERPILTIALAGLPGPALLTLAYLIAGPGSGAERYQIVPYWAAMTATGAGVLGSILAAVLRRASAADEPDDGEEAPEDMSSLPRRPNEPKSEIAQAAEAPTQFTPSARKGGSSAVTPAPDVPGDDPRAGTLRPSDTAVFDTPTGQVRPAPRSGGPRAAPWSPTAGGASAPLGSPAPQFPGGPGTEAGDAFPVRGSERPEPTAGRSATTSTPGHPGGVALGEYAGPEPTAFDGFARGEAKHGRQIHNPGHYATPEHAGNPDRFAPPGAALPGTVSGWSSPEASGWPSPEASGWSSPGGVNLDLTAPGRPAGDHAKPYVPEPATRPLPPEVVGQPAPAQPARGGALRGLRSLGRARAGGAAIDLPPPGRTAFAGADHPTIGAHASNPNPTTERAKTTERERAAERERTADRERAADRERTTERTNEPTNEPPNRRRSRRAPLVPEPHAISAPLPQPTPITPPLPQPKPLTPPRQSGPPPSMPDSRHTPSMPDSRHTPAMPDSRHTPATPATPDSRRSPGAPEARHSDAPAEDGRFSFGKPRPPEPTARSAETPADARPTTSVGLPTTTSTGHKGHSAGPQDNSADPQGQHAAEPGQAAAEGGRGRRSRFGLKKQRKENTDYVDWVSGLGNDPS
jgi:hypothetical protein